MSTKVFMSTTLIHSKALPHFVNKPHKKITLLILIIDLLNVRYCIKQDLMSVNTYLDVMETTAFYNT